MSSFTTRKDYEQGSRTDSSIMSFDPNYPALTEEDIQKVKKAVERGPPTFNGEVGFRRDLSLTKRFGIETFTTTAFIKTDRPSVTSQKAFKKWGVKI